MDQFSQFLVTILYQRVTSFCFVKKKKAGRETTENLIDYISYLKKSIVHPGAKSWINFIPMSFISGTFQGKLSVVNFIRFQ